MRRRFFVLALLGAAVSLKAVQIAAEERSGAAPKAIAGFKDLPRPPSATQFAKDAPTNTEPAVVKTPAEAEATQAKLRLREGTRLRDVSGRFRQNGETLTFVDEQKREIAGLPNLNLERILRMLKSVEEPESITWSVSGTVTEFGGRNYLLISRAVFKAATPPPAPDRLDQPRP